MQKFAVQKLLTQVDTCAWNDTSDLLACVADSRLTVYYYPHALYVDRDLLPRSTDSRDASAIGPNPTITSFFGNAVTVRKSTGAVLTLAVPPHPSLLYEYASAGR